MAASIRSATTIRTAAVNLPRVPMARIPIVVFANHVTPLSHAHSGHPSAYSSMPAGVRSGNKDSTWANTANKIADKLEDSAEKLSKDYLREVKHFDNAEDEMVKVYGLTMNSTNISGRATSENNQHHHHHHHNKSGGKGRSSSASSSVMTTFEQLLVDQVQADMIHPDAKPTQNTQHHSHMVSSLLEELKNDQTSNLSKHASDAIRMVESQHVLKQDKAPIHDVRNEDPSEKHLGSLKHA